MKKFLTILMAFALLLAVISNTMAYSEKENTSEEPPVHGYPIGTKSEQDGTLIDDGESNRGLPFSMTATGVQHFLTTDYENSTKHFTVGAFDGYVGEGLLITGSLTHTGGSVVRFGACYYNPSNDTYYTVQPMIAYSGSSISRFISKMNGMDFNFFNNTTYYGHVTNIAGFGSVSGYLDFSVSTQ